MSLQMPEFSTSLLSLAAHATTGTVTQPLFEIRTSATDYAIIQDIDFAVYAINSSTTQQGTLLLGTPAARGSGILASASMIEQDDLNSPCNVTIAYVWGTPPTAATTYYRRWGWQINTNTIGSARIYRAYFKRGLKLLPSASLVLFSLTTTASAVTAELTNLRLES